MATVTSIDRLERERRFHDAQAANRAETFAREPGRLCFRDEEYLDHESWVRPAMDALGNLAGRTALDWGCGHGMAAVVMARRGATVSACDLSAEYTRESSRRALANGATVRCLQADAHRLPFANESFDAVWGHAILHHLDIASAARELRRVMNRPGSRCCASRGTAIRSFASFAAAGGQAARRTPMTNDQLANRTLIR